MSFLRENIDYSLIFSGTFLFLIVGFWLRWTAAQAAELAPKSLGWVRNYRSGDYPFGDDRLGGWTLQPSVFVALLASVGFSVFSSIIVVKLLDPGAHPDLSGTYQIFFLVLRIVGTGAVYFLLQLLLRSPWVALPGTLLFSASSVRGHNAACLFSLCLLLLLLYLRAKQARFRGELLYWGACLVFSGVLALRPALIWLMLCFPSLHWYKLSWMHRVGRLSGGQLIRFSMASAVVWVLAACLSMVLRFFLLNGFQLHVLFRALHQSFYRRFYSGWMDALRCTALQAPTRDMLLELLLDAPLFGFGLWGCFSAWRLGVERRNGQGILILAAFALLSLTWLLSGVYLLSIGFALGAACLLRDADLGAKRWICIASAAAGVFWYLLIQYAASALPLTAGLLERIR